MITFQTLSELYAYVPACLICAKDLDVSIDGTFSPVATNKPRFNRGGERIHFKVSLEDGIVTAKSATNDIIRLDANSNKIIEGTNIVNRMLVNQTQVNKKCATCHLKINTHYSSGNIKKEVYFPPLTLRSEELHYTLRGGKRVRIEKYYYEHTSTIQFQLDGKYLPPVPFEFNKIKDITHLNKRIATIVLFH
jgi:hypothetical protein